MSQKYRVLALLLSGQAVSNFDLIKGAYRRGEPSSARLAARIFDLKKMGCKIKGMSDKDNRAKYWYQLKNPAFIKKMYNL